MSRESDRLQPGKSAERTSFEVKVYSEAVRHLFRQAHTGLIGALVAAVLRMSYVWPSAR
jgi:hypothetical protein